MKSAMEEKNERCVLCWKELDVLTTTPIEMRKYYIEGSGQLCEDCYEEIMGCRRKEDELIRKQLYKAQEVV